MKDKIYKAVVKYCETEREAKKLTSELLKLFKQQKLEIL